MIADEREGDGLLHTNTLKGGQKGGQWCGAGEGGAILLAPAVRDLVTRQEHVSEVLPGAPCVGRLPDRQTAMCACSHSLRNKQENDCKTFVRNGK